MSTNTDAVSCLPEGRDISISDRYTYNSYVEKGRRMVSIKDIARELNMAVSTVSMALNNNEKIAVKTRELVQEKAREMKYVKSGAALDLQKKKTNLILLVLHDASRSFFSNVIRECQSKASELGYDFIISTTYGGHTGTAEKFIRERRADAAIVYTKTIDDEILKACASESFPIFVLGHGAGEENPYVRSFAYTKTTEPLDTCEYLIAKGHRRIGFVKAFHDSYGTIRSLAGFRKAMENHGLAVDESLIFDAAGNYKEDGYRVTEEKILSRIDDMDAVIYSNDDIAIGGMQCFNDHGVVIPDQLSVISKHNIPASALTNPPLTTSTAKSDYSNYYDDLVQLLSSYIEGKPDARLEKKLADKQDEAVIVERQTVKDLNHTE